MKQQNLLRQAQLTSIILLLVSSVALAGCAGPAEAPVADPNPTDPTEVPIPNEVPPVGSSALPAAVETAVLQDIATTSNVPVEALAVTSSRPESWPDGCLGLGGPDEICTFAIVDGWEVTASDGEAQWVYRTDLDGAVIRFVDADPAG